MISSDDAAEDAGAATASRTSAPPARHFRAGPALMLALGALVVAVDQITKVVAVGALEHREPVRIAGDTVTLTLLRNSGAAFSLATEYTVALGVLAAAVVVGLLVFARRVHSRWWAWGLGLVLGGAAGNVVDRVFREPGPLRGHVVDFVSVGWWPVFNVADACLVTGVVTIAVTVLIGEDRTGAREHEREHREDLRGEQERSRLGTDDARG